MLRSVWRKYRQPHSRAPPSPSRLLPGPPLHAPLYFAVRPQLSAKTLTEPMTEMPGETSPPFLIERPRFHGQLIARSTLSLPPAASPPSSPRQNRPQRSYGLDRGRSKSSPRAHRFVSQEKPGSPARLWAACPF